jgi:uncharacterized membrane protein
MLPEWLRWPAWLGDALGHALRLSIWWVHAAAAVAWVGGSLFYLAALRPALRATAAGPEIERAVAGRFRELVEASLVALLVSGAVLAFDRLSSPAAGGAYLAVLGLKVLLALAMCWLAWELGWAGRRSAQRVRAANQGEPRTLRRRLGWRSPARLVLALGLVVVLLAIVLRQLFEAGLRATVSPS